MLRITIHDSSAATCFQLEGKLSGAWVPVLEQSWTAARAALVGRRAVLDLTAVSFVDAAGKHLLERMSAEGIELVAAGPLISSVCEEARRRRSKLALVAVLLSASLAVKAQTPEPAPLRLTLKDAVQMALRQNPRVQIAALDFAAAGQDTASARSPLLPQANFQLGERVQRTNIQALFGSPFPGIPQHLGPFETFTTGAYFSQTIFDLTLWRRWRASKENALSSGARVETVREQYAALVVSQYLGSLRASAGVQAAQSRVKLAEALYNQAGDLQKAGAGTGIDTLRANVELQNETQNLIAARTSLQTSLYGLSRLLGLDPAQPVEVADAASFFETPPIEVDRGLQAAYANRPEMKALEHQVRALELQKQAARNQRLPSARFDGFWTYLGLTPVSVIPAYTYEGTLQIPILTGGRIRAETARADIELKKVERAVEDQRNGIALEVKTAAAELDSARHQVDVATLGVKLANQEVEQARDRFQAGVANNIEVIQAQDALARASDNQIVALYRYNQARADLARATGQMQNLYAK